MRVPALSYDWAGAFLLCEGTVKVVKSVKPAETIEEMKDTDTSDLPQVAEKQLSKRKARK
jgi:hypothetical protein